MRCSSSQSTATMRAMKRARSSIRAPSSSSSLSRSSKRTAAPFPCTTISTFPTASRRQKRWSTPRAGYTSRDQRCEFFQQFVKVFEEDRRAVPLYNDKHLSYSFEKAKAMVDASRRLHFPMLAGSSIPVTWRLPSIELPLDCVIEDALMVGEGGSDAMDFHALEGLQCMVERRRGGETGVQAVQLVQGGAVWQAGEAGRYSKDLLAAALSRSDTPLGLTVTDGRTQDLVASNELPKLVKSPAAYFIEYRDGLKATLLMLDGAIKDFNFAARLKGSKEIWSTQFLLTPDPNVTYSACLMHKAEQMFETGVAPYPVERTLLTSGILESCLASKLQNNARLETPHLQVVYQAPQASQFAQT